MQRAAQRARLVDREKRILADGKLIEAEARNERNKSLIVMIVHARMTHFVDDLRETMQRGDLVAADTLLDEMHLELRELENRIDTVITDLDTLRTVIVNSVYEVMHTTAVHRNVFDDWIPDPELENLPVPPDVANSAIYIVREAATNTRRHAQAKSFNLSVRHCDGFLILEVWDDGTGFPSDSPRSGRGVRDINDFASIVDGTAEGPTNRSEGGVHWLVKLPCPVPGSPTPRLPET